MTIPAPAHTPGPWVVDENGLAGYGDNGPNFRIVDANSCAVCTLPLYHRLLDYGETPTYLAHKANARLIAAAPALVAALQELAPELRIMAEWTSGPTSEEYAAKFERARAALSLALGEQ